MCQQVLGKAFIDFVGFAAGKPIPAARRAKFFLIIFKNPLT